MKIMRTVYHAILKRMDPIDYAKRVGVNFPGGGVTHLWKSKLEYRAMADYAGK